MEKFLEKWKTRKFEMALVLITLLALGIRMLFLERVTVDYEVFLQNWFNEIKTNGGFFALKNDLTNCDYNFPYLLILVLLTYLPIKPLWSIKMVSILFDVLLALASMFVVKRLVEKKQKKYMFVTYALVLFWPTVVLNSAYWGQCDAIYATFVMVALLKLLDQKYFQSCCFLGIAFSFKMQFMFIVPLYALIFLTDKNLLKKLYYVFAIPVVNLLLCLPVILLRGNIGCAFQAYFTQLGEYSDAIVANFPNVYNLICPSNLQDYIVSVPNAILPKTMIVILAIIYLVTLIFFLKNKIKIQGKEIIFVGLWAVVLSTFLLPYMHDRYLYLADVLAILFFLVYDDETEKDAINIWVPLGIEICSWYSYIIYFSHYEKFIVDKRIVSLINLSVLLILTTKIFRKRRNV